MTSNVCRDETKRNNLRAILFIARAAIWHLAPAKSHPWIPSDRIWNSCAAPLPSLVTRHSSLEDEENLGDCACSRLASYPMPLFCHRIRYLRNPPLGGVESGQSARPGRALIWREPVQRSDLAECPTEHRDLNGHMRRLATSQNLQIEGHKAQRSRTSRGFPAFKAGLPTQPTHHNTPWLLLGLR